MSSYSSTLSRRDSLKLSTTPRFSPSTSDTSLPSFSPDPSLLFENLKKTGDKNIRDSQATIVEDQNQPDDSATFLAVPTASINLPGNKGKEVPALPITPMIASSATPPLTKPPVDPGKPKKVNFWGWVDVGFSHSTDDYDRKPITVDPLTKDDAIEVMEMRLAMKLEVQELYKWRNEYETSFPTEATSTSSRSAFTAKNNADEKSSGVIGVKKPDGVVTKRDSIATRFQQLGISRTKQPSGKNSSSSASGLVVTAKPVSSPYSSVTEKPQTASSKQPKGEETKTGKSNSAFDAKTRTTSQANGPRKWAWNDRSSTKK